MRELRDRGEHAALGRMLFETTRPKSTATSFDVAIVAGAPSLVFSCRHCRLRYRVAEADLHQRRYAAMDTGDDLRLGQPDLEPRPTS